MMYGGFDVFKTYLAIKNHFTSDYDYEKYGGRVTAKKSLQKSQIGTFFTNFLKDIMNEISWISLLLILLLIVISGWATL